MDWVALGIWRYLAAIIHLRKPVEKNFNRADALILHWNKIASDIERISSTLSIRALKEENRIGADAPGFFILAPTSVRRGDGKDQTGRYFAG
jgi:hypothetical protein